MRTFSRLYRFYNIIVGALGILEETLSWRLLVLGSHFLAFCCLMLPSFTLFICKNKEVELWIQLPLLALVGC